MFNNSYYNSAQVSLDRIDNQIKELEGMRAQLQRNMQPAINQTFQLAPNNNTIKYATSIEDVKKEIVLADSLFVNKEYTTLWLKTVKGDIRAFELKEIVEKDEKDLMIESLQKELEKLKGKDKDEQYDGADATTKSEN